MDVDKIVRGIFLDLDKALSQEQMKASLQRLEEDFYEKVREAIRLYENSPEGDKREANTRKYMLKKLIDLRSTKIIAAVLRGENVEDRLTKEEKELYNNIKALIEDFKRRVLEEKKKEISLCTITSDLPEPIVDITGRVLVLNKGDVLAISSEIASLFEKAGIGRRMG